jgi:drug/metabolite transporter (DMT)-like permease
MVHMSNELFGQLMAMGTALLWTLSALAWTSAGRYIGALPISFIRLIMTCPMLIVYGWAVRGIPFPTDATTEQWAMLGLSGFVGFCLSDLCLLKAFLLIGPRLSLIIFALSPPFLALLSWGVMGEPLPPLKWLAMGVTLLGVMWVVAEQPDRQQTHDLRQRTTGIILALVGAGWQAVAMLLVRAGLGDYDAGAATFIRVLGGMAGYLPMITLLGRWTVIRSAVAQPRAMLYLLMGSFVGPFLGVMFIVEALRHVHPGLVTTITSTMPVLIIPFSIFIYHERVSPRAALGAIVSVFGIGMLMLSDDEVKPPPASQVQYQSVRMSYLNDCGRPLASHSRTSTIGRSPKKRRKSSSTPASESRLTGTGSCSSLTRGAPTSGIWTSRGETMINLTDVVSGDARPIRSG